MISNIRIYSYSKCQSCRKALNWLRENNLDFDLVDIVDRPPDRDTLLDAIKQLGNRKSVFNTSGISYRKIGAAKVNSMSQEEVLSALLSDGKLIKRPFLIFNDEKILVGFKPEIWKDTLLA